MTDFVDFRPEDHGDSREDVLIRRAAAGDIDGLAAVMVARGDALGECIRSAERLIATAPVLLLAQRPYDVASPIIGWSGAVRIPIRVGGPHEWVIAGLTVSPRRRRRGVGATLLRHVVAATASRDPGRPVYSVVNVRNRASLSLHAEVGFTEVSRGESFAGITFDGGSGVLLATRSDSDTSAAADDSVGGLC